MKKFIKYLCVFFLGVIVLDITFGIACQYLNSHALGGDTKCHYYIAKECDEEVLIFGSSRAKHHYISSIISDSLGQSVYNCGLDGNGIVFMYSRLLMITNRYTPKVIIYDLNSLYDFEPGDNTQYLGWLKRFYDIPGISDVFKLVSPVEKLKVNSNLYRFNGSFIHLLMDNIKPQHTVGEGGYEPFFGEIDYELEVKATEQIQKWDNVKKTCMERFVNLCKEKKIQLIFVFSPSFSPYKPSSYDLAEEFALQQGIPFLNFANDTSFVGRKDLFADSGHMNDSGARLFMPLFINTLTKYRFISEGDKNSKTIEL